MNNQDRKKKKTK